MECLIFYTFILVLTKMLVVKELLPLDKSVVFLVNLSLSFEAL